LPSSLGRTLTGRMTGRVSTSGGGRLRRLLRALFSAGFLL
jgi:hypothetical protein